MKYFVFIFLIVSPYIFAMEAEQAIQEMKKEPTHYYFPSHFPADLRGELLKYINSYTAFDPLPEESKIQVIMSLITSLAQDKNIVCYQDKIRLLRNILKMNDFAAIAQNQIYNEFFLQKSFAVELYTTYKDPDRNKILLAFRLETPASIRWLKEFLQKNSNYKSFILYSAFIEELCDNNSYRGLKYMPTLDISLNTFHDGLTMLMWLVYGGSWNESIKKLAHYFLKYGADLNIQDDKMGYTALMHAAKFKNIHTLRFFLESGAKTQIRMDLHQTALDIALGNNAGAEIIQLLEKYQSQ